MKKLMVIAVLLVFFSGSAYAADWNFYGSARVSTFYSNLDNSPFAAGADTSNYEQNLNGNARIGAKVKVSDELTGEFQYGTLSGNANVRILWGEWNFGAGSLGVGQNYTPLLFPYSNQVYNLDAFNKGDHNMSTFGMLYGSRKAMIRLKFGGFQIAAVQPKLLVSNYATMSNDSGIAVGALPSPPFPADTYYYLANGQPDTEVTFPSIQAKYKYDFSNGHIAVAAGYQTFDVKGTEDYSVDSYILGVGGRLNFGGFYFKGNVWGGQNAGNMADVLVSGSLWSSAANAGTGTFDGAGMGLAMYNDGTIPGTTEGITDNDALAALIVVGYEIRKGLYLEAGYGYLKTELDMAESTKDDVNTYYLQSTIFLAPGVFLTPEIGRIDGSQDDQVDITYFGIKWQVNF